MKNIGPKAPWYERAEIKGTTVKVYSGGQVFRTSLNPLRNPVQRKGERVYWDELPGDTYAVTGVSQTGEKVSISSPSWHFVKGVSLSSGTRWLVRAGKRWKVNKV